jgi:PAS domain S-box-containing protein
LTPGDDKLPAARPDLEAALHAVFDDMFEGVQIIDFNWCYVYLNSAAVEHARRPLAELIGRRMPDLYPGIEQTELFRRLERCMLNRMPQQMQNHFTYPDGRAAWFELRMSPVPMGVVILTVDITERKLQEEELRRSREELALTLASMPDALITTDVERRVTRMNAAAERMIGFSEREAQGRSLDELVSFLDQRTGEPVTDAVEQVLREGMSIALANGKLLVRPDGEELPIASSGAPMRDASGKLRGVVFVIRNMKEEYELTRMLHQAQKMEAVGRLAGGVAHDFNNILTVILGCADLLTDDVEENTAAHTELEELKNAGERARELTRQLLTFSRGQAAAPELLAVNDVVARMEKMIRRLLGEDISLTLRFGDALPEVLMDRTQLGQVILNLVVNARDAMPAGGTLTIETARYTAEDGRAGAALSVADTGMGMSNDVRARIFEPFFSTKGVGQGTGLGLATSFGIVQESGGRIEVESEPGRGSRFVVLLPGG